MKRSTILKVFSQIFAVGMMVLAIYLREKSFENPHDNWSKLFLGIVLYVPAFIYWKKFILEIDKE